jgi:hypothetical protein
MSKIKWKFLEIVMPSMIEMLLNSGNSSPLAQLSSRFGISEEQARQAVEALAPALSIGMKRNTATPRGAGDFIEALSSGRHEQYADSPDHATSDDGIAEGNKILGHLLGSKDVSRAVAAQASQATGIGQSALKQMLPMLASMAMGAMFKGAKQGNAGGGGGILGQIMGGILGSGGLNPSMTAPGNENPLGKIFGNMLGGKTRAPSGKPGGGLGQVFEDMLGGNGRSSRRKTQPEAGGDGSLGDMLDEFLDGSNDDDRSRTTPHTRHAPSGNIDDLFGDMFETGRTANDPYQNGLESIFDKYINRR